MVNVKIVKVLGPFEMTREGKTEPVKVWTVNFIYGETSKTESWQREGEVEVLDPISPAKVKAAIKAALTAAKPHPLNGMEFAV